MTEMLHARPPEQKISSFRGPPRSDRYVAMSNVFQRLYGKLGQHDIHHDERFSLANLSLEYEDGAGGYLPLAELEETSALLREIIRLWGRCNDASP